MKLEIINTRKEEIQSGDLVQYDGDMGLLVYNSLCTTVYSEDEDEDTLNGELAEPYLLISLSGMVLASFENLNHVNRECELILRSDELILTKRGN